MEEEENEGTGAETGDEGNEGDEGNSMKLRDTKGTDRN